MTMNIFFLIPILLLQYNTVATKNNGIIDLKERDKPIKIESLNFTSYDSIKSKYDTLIPIFDGLFVTYHQIDSVNYFKYANKTYKNSIEMNYSEDLISSDTKKWGVIDSMGNVIIPFICDGVKDISANKGLLSVYSTSGSLNTGLPRYRYIGTSYFFTKDGLLPETKKDFMITIQFIADYHNSAFVIQQGPLFYLPEEYRIDKR